MSNELTNNPNVLPPVDGYDDDGSGPSSSGARFLKFDGSTQHLWFLREDGSVFPRGPYYAPDCWEENIKWVEKQPVDRVRKQPGESLPDIAELNKQCPKSEWSPDFNDVLQGPWRHTWNVGLVSPEDGDISSATQRLGWRSPSRACAIAFNSRASSAAASCPLWSSTARR
jgi:hypothetical protein